MPADVEHEDLFYRSLDRRISWDGETKPAITLTEAYVAFSWACLSMFFKILFKAVDNR